MGGVAVDHRGPLSVVSAFASESTAMALLCAVALPLLLAWLARLRRGEHQPPSAGGWLPLVGHALWYKRDGIVAKMPKHDRKN